MSSSLQGFIARAGLIGLTMVSTPLLSTPAVLAAEEAGSEDVLLAQGEAVPASTALSEARARAAAEAILETLRKGDAKARFEQFSDDLKRMTSPSMVAATMPEQPKILSYKILKVEPGLMNTTVQATLNTSQGPRQVLMILDEKGKLEGYHINRADKEATEVVRNFMDYIFLGHYISASSFLSPQLQEDLTPAILQSRWQNLQKRTGDAVRLKQIALAETGSDQKLVLVNTEFTRLTDNIFVVLDDQNQIVGLDFPVEPAQPSAAP
jgi:hypothetical protein